MIKAVAVGSLNPGEKREVFLDLPVGKRVEMIEVISLDADTLEKIAKSVRLVGSYESPWMFSTSARNVSDRAVCVALLFTLADRPGNKT